MNGVCNIDKIKEIMIRDYSENPNCIFLVECLQRKKDGMDNDNICVYRMTIDRKENIDIILSNAIDCAIKRNARVYVGVTPKDKKTLLLKVAQSCIETTFCNDLNEKTLEGVLYGAAARHTISHHPRYVFDFDIELESEEGNVIITFFNNIFNSIEGLKDKRFDIFKTPNGFHIVCDAYDYLNDEVISYINKPVKSVLINNFASNMHKTIEESKKVSIKRLLNSVLHKETQCTVVYYKGKG
jgi:hypothetical protein